MIWHKLFKRVDAPSVIPAPVLIFMSLLIVGVLAWQEDILSNQEHIPQDIIIELEQDTVEEIEDQGEIPEAVRLAVTTFVNDVKDKRIDAKIIRTSELYKALEADNQIDFISYAGRELTRNDRHDEALEVLSLISREDMLSHGSAFAFATSLSKEGRDKEALEVYAANHKAHPEHQAGAFNYGLVLAHADRHEEASTVLAYAASISSGALRGKALSAQADELMALGQVEKAILALRRSIEYRPNNSSTWRKLANAYQLSPIISQNEVIETYVKASALAPSKYRPLYDWANYLFSVGRFVEAIPLYGRAHSLAKDRFDIMFNRALNLQISGRPSSARHSLKSLEKQGISKSQAVLTSLLGAIINNDKNAIRSGVNKIEKSKKSSTDLYQYLLFLSALERNKTEIKIEIQQESPQNIMYRLPMQYAYASDLYDKKNYLEAAKIFKVISAESPQSSQFRYHYARALVQIGEQEEALKELAEAYNLEPVSKRISLAYSSLLLDMKQPDKAIVILENLLKIDPRYSRAVLQLAQIHTAIGDNEGSVKYLSQALELDSTDPEISLKLIQAQISLELFEEALVTTDEVLTIDSGLIEARMFRAILLPKLGNIQESYSEIDRILALNPNYEPAIKFKQSLIAQSGKPSND